MIISIIIPVYKVELYIHECIQSVMLQTMTKGVECILVDDGTPDNSINIANSLISEYQGEIKFQILHHDKNKGLSAARNTGLLEAQGEYVYFLDSDDAIIPECLELLWTMVEKYPKVDMVVSGAISSIEWLSFRNKILPDYSANRQWIKTTMLSRYTLTMTAWNKLISRPLLIDNNLFFIEGVIHEDEHFNFLLAKYITSVAICKSDTYIYRYNANGIKLSTAMDREMESWTIILNDMIVNIDSFCRKEQIMCILHKLLEIKNDGMSEITDQIVKNQKFTFRKLWHSYLQYHTNLNKMQRLKNRILINFWIFIFKVI